MYRDNGSERGRGDEHMHKQIEVDKYREGGADVNRRIRKIIESETNRERDTQKERGQHMQIGRERK